MPNSNINISIIIPVYRGAKILTSLFNQINSFCTRNNFSFEIIFVWDCGSHSSWEAIMSLKNQYPEVIKTIRLLKNYGQHYATICGFAVAEGKLYVTIDEDLQQDPEDLKLLIEKQTESNFDVVYGYYEIKKHSKFRNIASQLTNKIIKAGFPEINEKYSSFRLLKSGIGKEITKMLKPHSFIDGYISRITSNTAYCTVKHYKPFDGRSSYSLFKLTAHLINILLSHSHYPKTNKETNPKPL